MVFKIMIINIGLFIKVDVGLCGLIWIVLYCEGFFSLCREVRSLFKFVIEENKLLGNKYRIGYNVCRELILLFFCVGLWVVKWLVWIILVVNFFGGWFDVVFEWMVCM